MVWLPSGSWHGMGGLDSLAHGQGVLGCSSDSDCKWRSWPEVVEGVVRGGCQDVRTVS